MGVKAAGTWASSRRAKGAMGVKAAGTRAMGVKPGSAAAKGAMGVKAAGTADVGVAGAAGPELAAAVDT